jgi:putative phage-type endonuclease
MGLHPYKTAYQVCEEKTGRDSEDVDSDLLWYGREIEPILANRFEEITGLPVQQDNRMWTHPEHPILKANVDRIILNNDQFDGNGILELKSTSKWNLRNWETEVPANYYLQAQHYMLVKGYDYGFLCIIADRQVHVRPDVGEPFYADPEIQQMIIEKAKSFWQDHVLADEPPEPTSQDDLSEIYQTVRKGEAAFADESDYMAYQDLKDVKSEIKQLKKRKKELETKLKNATGEAERLVFDGKELAKRIEINRSGYTVDPTTYTQFRIQ